MATQENKVLVRRFIDEVFVKGNPDAVDKLVTSDFTPHSWGNMPPGVEPLKQAIGRVRAGLTDASFKIEDTTGKGHITHNIDDRIVVTIPLEDQTVTHTATTR